MHEWIFLSYYSGPVTLNTIASSKLILVGPLYKIVICICSWQYWNTKNYVKFNIILKLSKMFRYVFFIYFYFFITLLSAYSRVDSVMTPRTLTLLWFSTDYVWSGELKEHRKTIKLFIFLSGNRIHNRHVYCRKMSRCPTTAST